MSAPTSLPGYMDTGALDIGGYGAIVDYLLENTPALTHPESVRTFARMRHEPQLAAILRVYVLALERASWSVDGDGCRTEVTEAIADDLGLPIKGQKQEPSGARRRRFSWSKHLRTAAPLSMTFGHAPFAQSWVEQDGRYRLDIVQERMPQTIAEIKLNPDGTLRGVLQDMAKAPLIGTANHQLVWYARERQGSNYFGESIFRPSYGLWLIKDQMLRVHATSIRRFGMGIPEVQAPPGATPQQIAEAQRYAQSITAGDRAGAGVPNGFSTSWRGMTGSVPDALAFVNYLDRLMTRATLTSILDMATAEKGNRSLGETVMDLMVYAQQAEAQRIAEDATEQIVIPLVDANWGSDEPCPTVCVEDVGADVQLTAQDVNWLLQWGGLRPDAPARAWIRHRWSIPDEDPNDPVNQAPTPNNSDPQGGH